MQKVNMDWKQFLGGVPAGDYVFQNTPYEEQIRQAAVLIREAEIVLIGAGAGASAAAGLTYSGKRFTDNFSEFIQRYGKEYMTDMYAAGFYPFPTQEAKWGYWSKHSMVNRFLPPALSLYRQIYEMVKEKDYFVLTTNVDHQFHKAGFQTERIFATQGDYGNIQCEKGCHPKIYDAEKMFRQMDQARRDCVIPSYMVPKCPVCGGNMTMHLRCDEYFVEDENWHEAAFRYSDFLKRNKKKKSVLLEIGVGFNTPAIIRFPFEKMMCENYNLSLIRLNLNEAAVPESLENRAIGIGGDMAKAMFDLYNELEGGSEMTHEEQRSYLIHELLGENLQYHNITLPSDTPDQKNLLRALMNVRPPKPIREDFLKVQDEYLSAERDHMGVVDGELLPALQSDNRLVLWQGDITTLKADAIVNAANSALRGCFCVLHSCIDNIIHSRSGIQLRLTCDKIMNAQGHDEPTGQAKITPAFNLPSRYVLHTVGPIIHRRVTRKDKELLASCYRSCLELAAENGLKSVAFCCISTGEFHFPNQEAAEIAVKTVQDFLKQNTSIERVIFNVFKDTDLAIYRKLLGENQC